MKTYVAAAPTPLAKRRWKWFATAVLALVFFSLLVPLAFLLGLHNRFPSGYLGDDRSSSDPGFGGYDKVPNGHDKNLPQDGQSTRVDGLIRKFGSDLPKDTEKSLLEAGRTRETQSHFVLKGDTLSNIQGQDDVFHPKGYPSPQAVGSKTNPIPHTRNVNVGGNVGTTIPIQESNTDETKKPCEVKYGSYCLWSVKHKEELKDSLVKKLKDQVFVARAYYPSIAKLPSQEFSREVKQNIQEHEHMLSEAIVDADLPIFVEKNIQKMEETIAKAKSFNVDCNNVDKKLTQILEYSEDEAHFHMRQGAFLYHLGVQTTPKSLHCLSMRLTVEYFKDPSSVGAEIQSVEKFDNPAFRHYVIFSKNVLASSVTVNSTVMNAKVSKNLVFHVLTDEQSYYAMKFWFSKNSYKEAVIDVLNIENLGLNISYNSKLPRISFAEEFRISVHDSNQTSSVQMRTEYISIFGHSHFLLPDIFQNLKKVVVLDDDVVVQQDLSPLWSLDLRGNVNGAVHYCKVKLGQLKHYLRRQNFSDGSCTWMSGLNIVDLEKWRERDITSTYQMLQKEVGDKRTASWRAAALPISLLAFRNLTYPLEDTWVLSGLGKDYGVSKDTIAKAAVLHYNGNMKPWLEVGVPKYKLYWRNFLTRDNQFMDECNANP